MVTGSVAEDEAVPKAVVKALVIFKINLKIGEKKFVDLRNQNS